MVWFVDLNPIIQALIAGLFTWGVTILGSSLVFFVNEVNDKLLAVMNGFAAGVMIAASFWSLLAPSIDYAQALGYGRGSFIPAAVGFLLGGVVLRLVDRLIPHMHVASNQPEGPDSHWSKTLLLFIAITIHNIPEGLSIGVAFGAAAIASAEGATLAGAVALALGIGLQNFPEGSALSLPIRAGGEDKWRAFHIGQLSAIVEPVAAVLGAWLVLQVTSVLPYALSFAAGAMFFVCIEELIPDSQKSQHSELGTMAFMLGFVVMMTLDVALG